MAGVHWRILAAAALCGTSTHHVSPLIGPACRPWTKGSGSKSDAKAKQRKDLAWDCSNPDKVSEFLIADMTSV